MISLCFFLFIPTFCHRFREAQSILIPANPTANSQAYLRTNNVSSYSIHAGNRTGCRFKTAVIPCECIKEVSEEYVLYEHGSVLAKFSVEPPDIRIKVPSNHELLQELNVYIDSKLCLADKYNVLLHHRTIELSPGVSPEWRLVAVAHTMLHNQRISVLFPCTSFEDKGIYRVSLVSPNNYTISSKEILVNRTTESSMQLRNDSIFPHCSSELTLSWKIAKCPATNLHYRMRILAVPEGNVDHEDRVHYIEEIGLEPGQTSLSIRCSQFDIIYEKYCFQLVSHNKNSSIFNLWQSSCVSTEPVLRKDGGWSEWAPWSECSSTCGEGTSRRYRICDNPSPLRGKSCIGDVLESRTCTLAKCPEATRRQLVVSNCSCGCKLDGKAGSFFATSSVSEKCSGNQTWWFHPHFANTVLDIAVTKDPGAKGKLFFFLGQPYGELIWFSGSNQEPQFTLRVDIDVYVVLWSKEHLSNAVDDHRGFTVVYSIRAPEPPAQLAQHPSPCHPFCPETVIISVMGILFMLIIFIPPFVCANITQRVKRNSTPDLPLIDKKYESEMIRSGNTECTQVSSSKAYVAKRSIGIQLSVQNTPRLTRACPSADSPLPRGASSLSASDELEYDYYDGTTIPGSLLAPLDDVMFSQIDIDQIIGRSEIFNENVSKQDVHTQI